MKCTILGSLFCPSCCLECEIGLGHGAATLHPEAILRTEAQQEKTGVEREKPGSLLTVEPSNKLHLLKVN